MSELKRYGWGIVDKNGEREQWDSDHCPDGAYIDCLDEWSPSRAPHRPVELYYKDTE